MMGNDKSYWEEYYRKNSKPAQPSSFAKFVSQHIEENRTLVELGCGNGRDSLYFAEKLNVIAIDQVECEMDYLNREHKTETITFLADDFTNLKNAAGPNRDELDKKIDYIYSRFTFHSINEKKENSTLDWIESTLDEDGMFFLEARSIKDPMFMKGTNLSETENFTDHYRRYMNFDKIIEKIESRNFEIIFKIEDKDLAVYKDDNPYVIRIIAKKLA